MSPLELAGLRKADIQQLINARFTKQPITLKHLHPALILKQMLNIPSWEWSDEQLNILPQKQLKALCLIMGAPKSGTKAKIITRLKAIASVRLALKDYNRENIQQLADAFKGKQLKDLCKAVGASTAGGTKYSMAASLINWKISSANRGKHNWNEAMAEAKANKAAKLAA